MRVDGPSPIGLGLFPLREAARLARLDVRVARRWAGGHRFRARDGAVRVLPGVLHPALTPIGRHHDLTFAEMLTLRLVKQFKDTGLSLRTIKRVAERAATEFDLPHPFISRRFRTDGRRIFLELRGRPVANDEHLPSPRDREVIEVLTGQRQFAEVVEPSFKDLEWEDDLASRWWPLTTAHSVVVDPRVLFGAPHIAGTRVPTAPVAAAAVTEGSEDAAAQWFGILASQVRDAVRFEAEWPASRAA